MIALPMNIFKCIQIKLLPTQSDTLFRVSAWFLEWEELHIIPEPIWAQAVFKKKSFHHLTNTLKLTEIL